MEEERLQHYSANAQKETQVERAMQHICTPLRGRFMVLAGDAEPRVFDPVMKKILGCNSSNFAKWTLQFTEKRIQKCIFLP